MHKDEPNKKPVELAKQDFTLATDHLVEAAKRHAVSAIADLATQISASTHDVSEAVASGLRNVKAELHLPKTVKEHPYAWVAGGVAVGAAGLLVLRGVARSLPRPMVRGAVSGSLGGKLALTALELGFSYWLTRRQGKRALARVAEEGSVALH